MTLSKIPTNSRIKKSMDPGKKKILFVLGIIFTVVVLFGIYNLKKVVPGNKEKIPIKIQSGDQPMTKKLSVIVSGPLNMRKDRDAKSDKVGIIPGKANLVRICPI